MLCSNCGSPRTRYVKTISNSKVQEKMQDQTEIYRCTTCGGTFEFKR